MKLDLKRLIADFDLDVNELSGVLYPGNKHARLALNRVKDGLSRLDSEQIAKMAAYYAIPLEVMFGGPWAARKEGRTLTFNKGSLTIKLNTDTWESFIFHENEMVFKNVISEKTISLEEYLTSLEQLYKTKTQ